MSFVFTVDSRSPTIALREPCIVTSPVFFASTGTAACSSTLMGSSLAMPGDSGVEPVSRTKR